ncbi:MAG: hypothetical protein IKI45_07740 [Oscillospiraceae bacterium]|nr:hypothetical protein [Oscillospiraceae bacterium]
MSESRFMKTVLFGGYDREGVEQKFERLSAKLFELENELSENRSLLASVQNGGDEAAALRDMLEQVRGELSKVQAKQETAAHQLRALDATIADKDREIESLKAKVISLQDQIRERDMKLTAFEADDDTKPARAAIAEVEEKAHGMLNAAKKDAAKLEENSRKLSENVIAEANNTAQRIIYEAEAKSAQILANAQNRCSETEAASGNLRALLLADVDRLSAQFRELQQAFSRFQNESTQSIGAAAGLLQSTDQILKQGGIPVFTAPQTVAPELPAPPAETPVTHDYYAEETAAPPTQEDKNAELARLQQMANAIAGISSGTGAPAPAHQSLVPDLAALAAQADAIAHRNKQ